MPFNMLSAEKVHGRRMIFHLWSGTAANCASMKQ